MSNLIYLGIAVALSLVGCTVLWLRNRPPRSLEQSIRAFSKELEALAPDDRSYEEVRDPRDQNRGWRTG